VRIAKLLCQVTPGIFSGEVAVTFPDRCGRVISVNLPAERVTILSDLHQFPIGGRTAHLLEGAGVQALAVMSSDGRRSPPAWGAILVRVSEEDDRYAVVEVPAARGPQVAEVDVVSLAG
jgi:hypothetical protein